MTNEWIEWNGGECPIKSDKTVYVLKFRTNIEWTSKGCDKWDWKHYSVTDDIIAYRITEDHEPMDYDALPIYTHKMTRGQIEAQIDALQKQLDALPLVNRIWYGKDCGVWHSDEGIDFGATHFFDIETINGVPHIHGVAMKKVGK